MRLSQKRYQQLLRRFRLSICNVNVNEENHAELFRILSILEGQDASWVDELVKYVKENSPPNDFRQRISHALPNADYWLDSDVQNGLSDIVGWGYARMQRVKGSRRFIYQFVGAHPA